MMGGVNRWLASLSVRERWFAAGFGFSTLMMVGLFTSRLISIRSLEWEGVAALVAVVALIFAVFGYFDNRRAQQLEHRAYLSVTIPEARIEKGGALTLKIVATNFGRTPASDVRCSWSVAPENRAADDFSQLKSGEWYWIKGEFYFRDVNPPHPETEVVVPSEQIRDVDAVEIVWERLCLHVEVSIKYNDVFGVEQITEKTFDFSGAVNWGAPLDVFYLDAAR